ncbi:NUDIX hydrolase [Neorhizobium sp. P12A]|uniref:NUDIX hydrolase n=1 Tax=Neorhizobium sp. P12A TaxID=2268027 RepID=UPI0011EBAEC4|nr:NUDIX domain-containing protein [Neorhizobium sp. P12A]KAA0689169.1 NUDIX hydrolase [Neorhizobium sp. P12A]
MPDVDDTGIARLSSTHELSVEEYERQYRKFLDHGRTGGALGVLLTSGSKVVLIKRTGLHAGWAIPGGTLEEGEEPETALRRELQEELRFQPSDLTMTLLEEKVFRSPSGEELRFDLHVFIGRLDFDFDEMTAPEDELDIECIKAFAVDLLPGNMILSDRAKLDIIRGSLEGAPTYT